MYPCIQILTILITMENRRKTLYLLRHGKSAWDHIETEDIQRKLLPKGIERTQRIAHYMSDINIKIDAIISSPAQRAIQTATIIEKALHLPEIIIEGRLYPCTSNAIFDTIIELDNTIDNILIVAHNPGITYFAQEYIDANIDQLHTSGLVSCSFDCQSWTEFSLANKKLNFVVSPKKLS